MSVQKTYATELRDNYGYHAAWDPGNSFALGDVGRFDRDGIFIRETNLAALGVEFEATPPSAKTDLQPFKSSSVKSVKFKAAGKAVPEGSQLLEAKAGFSIDFGRTTGVIFTALGRSITRIDNQPKLGREILALYAEKEWDHAYCVITELMTVNSMTILVSNQAGGKAEIVADANVGRGLASLAQVNASVAIVEDTSLHTSIVGAAGGTPLFRVSGLKWDWYWPFGKPTDFGPKAAAFTGASGGSRRKTVDTAKFGPIPIKKKD